MKTTKKNWILRLTGIALVFTLVSTCLLSGTLAKYITSASGTDSARVAKWGVDVKLDSGLFNSEYLMHDSGKSLSGQGVISVQSQSTSENVVAPGTDGKVQTFSITGQPEVAVQVQVNTTGSKLTGKWQTEDGQIYEPVLWSLKKDGTDLLENTSRSFNDLLSALYDLSGEYLPNTNLSDIYGTYEISWDWVFSDNTDETDKADTYLGNLKGEDVPEVTLAMDISVTQID